MTGIAPQNEATTNLSLLSAQDTQTDPDQRRRYDVVLPYVHPVAYATGSSYVPIHTTNNLFGPITSPVTTSSGKKKRKYRGPDKTPRKKKRCMNCVANKVSDELARQCPGAEKGRESCTKLDVRSGDKE